MSNMYQVVKINAFQDNYIWALVNNGKCAIVDPGDAKPVLQFLHEQQLQLVDILLTHHHPDHIGGVAELKSQFPNVKVFGPNTARFNMVDQPCHHNSASHLNLGITLQVLSLPGHTIDHIGFYDEENLFVGDTLFSAGCGRLFEGTAEQMFQSLNLLTSLPAETKVYCAHEYTLANLQFAKAADDNNPELNNHLSNVEKLREQDEATVPTTIQLEMAINPFLRANELTIKKKIQQTYELAELPDELECFTLLRKWKDNF